MLNTISKKLFEMNIREKLIKYEKKNIELADLAAILGIPFVDTESLYNKIMDLINEHIIEPVKSSDTNGNKKYPLHKKYRIAIDNANNEQELLKEIKKLHPVLQKSGYLSSHPQKYQKNREIIHALSSYYFSEHTDQFISRKEKSFEIFGREKVLDQKEIRSLLHHLGITEESLGFYDTPEYCFHDYIPVRKDTMTLLICENKDIWFNIRRLMFEDKVTCIFGTEIDGVVFGNGNKVSQKQGALTEYVRFMGNLEVHFLYWGDIDREGFEIYRRTKEVNASLDIRLFLPGYEKMIERARGLQKIEDSPSSRLEDKSYDDLITDFSMEDQAFLRNIFAENKLVPQEIISYVHLNRRETDASF